MKKVFFALVATAMFSVNSFAENKNDNQAKEELKQIEESVASCKITSGVMIEDDDEMIYQSVTVFQIDGMTCEQFFCALSPIGC